MMKKILISAALVAVTTATANAQSRSFYSSSGSFAGSSVTCGGSTSFYNGSGHFSGSSIRHGNSTSFYNSSGHFTGSSINTSPRR
jgi:hypothetical protein